MKTTKVLIVDDSAVIRKVLSEILSSDESIEVIGTASDPIVAASKMSKEAPDVITLDIEMPRMNGISFLKKIMTQHPLPVVICSSFVKEGSDVFNKVLEYGATDIILKPKFNTAKEIEEATILICDTVKAAAAVKPSKLAQYKKTTRAGKQHSEYHTADVMLKSAVLNSVSKVTEQIIVIGASTGGTQALTTLLSMLPANSPGIVIVQHMPEGFTRSFAQRLDSLCKIKVKEAKNGDTVEQGVALIAPGDYHILCKSRGDGYYVEVKQGPLVSRHRPSVDVLFRSAARFAGNNAIGVIMTGMGNDGAKSMKEMYDVGAKTIAQDEKSSVVFGMPKEAIATGGVHHIVSLEQIAHKLMALVK